MERSKPDDTAPLFGARLRGRVGTALKIAAEANCVRGSLNGTHSSTVGSGANILYVMGADLLIQRFVRWNPNSTLRYSRRDIIALEHLPNILFRTTGLLAQLQQQGNRQTLAKTRPIGCLTERIDGSSGRNEQYPMGPEGWCDESDQSGTDAEKSFDEQDEERMEIPYTVW